MFPHRKRGNHPFKRARAIMPTIRRGDLKFLILQVLKDKSTHGYEIMKVLSKNFGGFYFPSPGAVYPTLQMLEDVDLIKFNEDNGKKIYSITPDGLKFLDERSERVKKIMKRVSDYLKTGKFKIFKDYRRTANLIMNNYEDLTPEKLEAIEKVIEDTRKKIGAIILS